MVILGSGNATANWAKSLIIVGWAAREQRLERLTLHVSSESVFVGEAVVWPLLSEGDLDTVLHLHVVDLGEASDEQVDHDKGGVIWNARLLYTL